jgi:hypothetical protein
VALPQAALVEILLHGEGRSEQADAGEPRGLDPLGRGIGDVEQRDAHGGRDRIGQAMHGVGAQHDEVRAAPLQPERGLPHRVGQPVPLTLVLKPLDRVEIDGPHQALRRMHAAQPPVHLLIDDAVVLGRAFPAHAADEADGLHHGLQGFGV